MRAGGGSGVDDIDRGDWNVAGFGIWQMEEPGLRTVEIVLR